MLRRKRQRPQPQIPITPLIDIVFLLLIFFMLVTRFLSPSIAVALPESDSGEMDESRAITVSVDADGNYYLDDNLLGLDEITSLIAAGRNAGDFDVVRLHGDSNADWQLIINAFEAIRDAGVFDIAIVTESPVDLPEVE